MTGLLFFLKSIYIYIYIYVCMYVCMYVCIQTCVKGYLTITYTDIHSIHILKPLTHSLTNETANFWCLAGLAIIFAAKSSLAEHCVMMQVRTAVTIWLAEANFHEDKSTANNCCCKSEWIDKMNTVLNEDKSTSEIFADSAFLLGLPASTWMSCTFIGWLYFFLIG